MRQRPTSARPAKRIERRANVPAAEPVAPDAPIVNPNGISLKGTLFLFINTRMLKTRYNSSVIIDDAAEDDDDGVAYEEEGTF